MPSPFLYNPNQIGKQFAVSVIWDQTLNNGSGSFRCYQNTDVGGGQSTTVFQSYVTGSSALASGIALNANQWSGNTTT